VTPDPTPAARMAATRASYDAVAGPYAGAMSDELFRTTSITRSV
jgi:hypothetical protein